MEQFGKAAKGIAKAPVNFGKSVYDYRMDVKDLEEPEIDHRKQAREKREEFENKFFAPLTSNQDYVTLQEDLDKDSDIFPPRKENENEEWNGKANIFQKTGRKIQTTAIRGINAPRYAFARTIQTRRMLKRGGEQARIARKKIYYKKQNKEFKHRVYKSNFRYVASKVGGTAGIIFAIPLMVGADDPTYGLGVGIAGINGVTEANRVRKDDKEKLKKDKEKDDIGLTISAINNVNDATRRILARRSRLSPQLKKEEKKVLQKVNKANINSESLKQTVFEFAKEKGYDSDGKANRALLSSEETREAVIDIIGTNTEVAGVNKEDVVRRVNNKLMRQYQTENEGFYKYDETEEKRKGKFGFSGEKTDENETGSNDEYNNGQKTYGFAGNDSNNSRQTEEQRNHNTNEFIAQPQNSNRSNNTNDTRLSKPEKKKNMRHQKQTSAEFKESRDVRRTNIKFSYETVSKAISEALTEEMAGRFGENAKEINNIKDANMSYKASVEDDDNRRDVENVNKFIEELD